MGDESAHEILSSAMAVARSQLQSGERLDAIVAYVVFGNKIVVPYSTEISAAWEVRKQMEKLGWESEDHQFGDDGKPTSYVFRFLRWQTQDGKYMSKPIAEHQEVESIEHAPFAICAAAIKALSLIGEDLP